MNYYICNYSDYERLPDTLFTGNTPGKERKSKDGSKFIARSETDTAGNGSLSWMNGNEIILNRSQIQSESRSSEWDE